MSSETEVSLAKNFYWLAEELLSIPGDEAKKASDVAGSIAHQFSVIEVQDRTDQYKALREQLKEALRNFKVELKAIADDQEKMATAIDILRTALELLRLAGIVLPIPL